MCHRRKVQALPAVKASGASCLFSSSIWVEASATTRVNGADPSDGIAAFALGGRSIILRGEAGGMCGCGLCKWSQNGAQLLSYVDFKCPIWPVECPILHTLLCKPLCHGLFAYPGRSAPVVVSYNNLMMYPTGSLSSYKMQYPTASSSSRTALGGTYNQTLMQYST